MRSARGSRDRLLQPASHSVSPSALLAFSAVQRSSSLVGTSRLRPRRIRRSSGATLASKKSGPTPIAAAASGGVSAIRGIDTASFLAMPNPAVPAVSISSAHHPLDEIHGLPVPLGPRRAEPLPDESAHPIPAETPLSIAPTSPH